MGSGGLYYTGSVTSKTKVFNDALALPGFIKTRSPAPPELSGEQRSALVRRGNELFNRGAVEDAKRIFVTVGYTDGLIRLGDHYMKRNEPLEAFRMYWLAPDKQKADYLIERMAGVVRNWLKEAQ
jgi:hypothetical protein